MNASALAIAPSSYDLASIDENKLKRLTSQLVSSVTGAYGHALSPMQASQLALITLTTDLSPFLGEVYCTEKGIMIGVLAYERKAQEYLDAFHPGDHYYIAYREAIPKKEADFDPEAGDIAFVARLTRDDWNAVRTKQLNDFMRMLRESSITGKEAFEIARAEVGSEKFVEAVGVVDYRESFSGEYKKGDLYEGEKKPEMFDRFERAKKRAAKHVIKHTFPRLSIPDPLKIMAEPVAQRLIEVGQEFSRSYPVSVPQGATPAQLERQLRREMGYSDPEPEPQSVTIPASARPVETSVSRVAEESERPFSAAYTRQRLLEVARELRSKPLEPERERGLRHSVRTHLEGCFAGKDASDKRKTVQKYVFGRTSSTELEAFEINALHKWLEPRPDTSEEWRPNSHSVIEAQRMYEAALEEEGQKRLFA